ncbi:hypothetical protein [Paenibacillus sp. DYY-L-2]|uniref:hypothetical protein n=1 Tax=Paenibacillus sp. DYY-L-2 TaxID=3447013 RepID=UPI003F509F48
MKNYSIPTSSCVLTKPVPFCIAAFSFNVGIDDDDTVLISERMNFVELRGDNSFSFLSIHVYYRYIDRRGDYFIVFMELSQQIHP